ncbi:RTA1 like protein [Dothidotthia symphoricarpi CBS 119687]|uniref:RTA1 like protein n=1 Tax=Dothidotthia symphoricarpi CBS 119687 TaxID=1392245 RepID=A0A6A6A2R0_9PLEO|nr:RTA1 like protein [Dothidotthia symphoricarpi CBS 119687]KAF2126292.1 RTA1 like protein [Dothidotthia symphoricarpi CBS 119687]
MPTLEAFRGNYYLWHYIPSLPAAIIFAILFIIVTIAHTWKMARARMWFCLPFVIGGFFEVIGYAGHAAATNSTGKLMPYIIQSTFLLLPPVLFAATLYMVYSRVVQAVSGARFSLIPPHWSTRVFVAGDVLCMLMQTSGAGLLAQSDDPTMGERIIIGGLLVQIVVFTGFVGCCWIFHRRFKAHLSREGAATRVPWQSCLTMLYATSLLISIRNVYRLVEYSVGHDGYLFSVEWPVYVLDGVLMLFVMVLFMVWYPDQLRTQPRGETYESVELGQNGKH